MLSRVFGKNSAGTPNWKIVVIYSIASSFLNPILFSSIPNMCRNVLILRPSWLYQYPAGLSLPFHFLYRYFTLLAVIATATQPRFICQLCINEYNLAGSFIIFLAQAGIRLDRSHEQFKILMFMRKCFCQMFYGRCHLQRCNVLTDWFR